jgi:hypothetical protein
LQALQESRETGLSFGIAGGPSHEDADAPHPLALLRTSRKRLCGHGATEQRDELAKASVDPLVELLSGWLAPS